MGIFEEIHKYVQWYFYWESNLYAESLEGFKADFDDQYRYAPWEKIWQQMLHYDSAVQEYF